MQAFTRPAPGLWRRTPPAIFPPVMGLFGLGLALRAGAPALGYPAALAEALLGAVTLLYLFTLVAWLAKPLRRAAVVGEELRVLPGRAGLAALTLSGMLLAAALVPYAPGAARAVAIVAFTAHSALALMMLWLLARAPAEGRVVTPVWHLLFVGFILGPLAGIPLGHGEIARIILFATMPVAAAIWVASLWQLVRRIPPSPLRPLLAIHLAPASLFATVSSLLGLHSLALGFAALATVIFVALLASGRWIIESGFSPLWGAFTFPLAAFASALVHVTGGHGAAGLFALAVLLLALAAVPVIAYRVLRLWSQGGLAAKTNAAEV